jgi:hypothetical protein
LPPCRERQVGHFTAAPPRSKGLWSSPCCSR